jgi:hypothetical protein
MLVLERKQRARESDGERKEHSRACGVRCIVGNASRYV